MKKKQNYIMYMPNSVTIYQSTPLILKYFISFPILKTPLLSYLYFHPFEFVSRYRDPQLQVDEY